MDNRSFRSFRNVYLSLPPELFAKVLDYLEFPEVVSIIKSYKYGHMTILPHITHIYTPLVTINPYNLTRCCMLRELHMPYSRYLNNNMLLMLPNLNSLTIMNGSLVTSDIFEFLPNLKNLTITYQHHFDIDTLVNLQCLKYLDQLEYLHISNRLLFDDCFTYMPKLKVLILKNSRVTPSVLNLLPKLELCVINGVLIKYTSSLKNIMILKHIGKLHRIKIYAI